MSFLPFYVKVSFLYEWIMIIGSSGVFLMTSSMKLKISNLESVPEFFLLLFNLNDRDIVISQGILVTNWTWWPMQNLS